MTEFLNHHIATTAAVIHSGTDHPEMLKPLGEASLGNTMRNKCQSITPHNAPDYKGKSGQTQNHQ